MCVVLPHQPCEHMFICIRITAACIGTYVRLTGIEGVWIKVIEQRIGVYGLMERAGTRRENNIAIIIPKGATYTAMLLYRHDPAFGRDGSAMKN